MSYEKGSDLAKAWKIRKAPTLILIDNRGEAPRLLKSLRGGSAQSIKAALLSAVKKLSR